MSLPISCNFFFKLSRDKSDAKPNSWVSVTAHIIAHVLTVILLLQSHFRTLTKGKCHMSLPISCFFFF